MSQRQARPLLLALLIVAVLLAAGALYLTAVTGSAMVFLAALFACGGALYAHHVYLRCE